MQPSDLLWPDRFVAKVLISDRIWRDTHCWEWTGGRNGPYGRFHPDWGGTEYVHRYALIIIRPKIDITGLVVDHLCRFKLCVRPNHLEAVTQAINVQRGNAMNHTMCGLGLHPWVPDNITELQYPSGKRARRCRACHRDRERERARAKAQQRRTCAA